MRLLPTVMPVLGFLAATVLAQGPDRIPDLTIDDIVALLDIGVPDEEIVAFCDTSGWPDVTERSMVRVRQHGMGQLLERRLLATFRGKSDLERLAEDFEVTEGALPAGARFTFLTPRGWKKTVGNGGTRLTFDAHEQEGLLLRNSLFVWFHEGSEWQAENARGLAHVVVGAFRDRLSADGMRMGVSTEEVLIHRRTGREYPFFHAIVTDAKTRVRALLAIAMRIDDDVDVVTVAGFLTRIDEGPDTGADAKSRLAEMMATLQFQAR